MAEPLASVDDLAARLGRELDDDETARIEALLADASAAVRSYTGQQFTRESTTSRLRVAGRSLRLPQRPVIGVSAVADVDGNDVSFSWYAGEVLGIDSLAYPTGGWVDVTYEHGYEEVPADVVAVVCNVALRAFGVAAGQSGLASETIGTYSYSIGGAAASGPLGMLADERQVLDSYRRAYGTAWLAS